MPRFISILLLVAIVGFSHAAEPFEGFLQKHCIACHGPEKTKGDLRLDQLSRNFKSGVDGQVWAEADGFHPAGAVIDPQRGVQHIFIYTGHPNGPAGVFRITRTLRTNKLTELLTLSP